jgi:hypothetical protein
MIMFPLFVKIRTRRFGRGRSAEFAVYRMIALSLFDTPEPFPGREDHCVAPNGKGGCFFKGKNSVFMSSRMDVFRQRTSEKDFTNAINALYTDRSGQLWIGGKEILVRL